MGVDKIELPKNATSAANLKSAAELVMKERVNQEGFDLMNKLNPNLRKKSGICGLYSGGSLCAEAQITFKKASFAISSNAPVPGVEEYRSGELLNVFLDLGSDEFTMGKPHPMLDPLVRDELVLRAISDPKIGVLLIDIVLGFGAHADPVGLLAKVVGNKILEENIVVISSITGTNEDPQDFLLQKQKLRELGILIAPSNFDAAELALECLRN